MAFQCNLLTVVLVDFVVKKIFLLLFSRNFFFRRTRLKLMLLPQENAKKNASIMYKSLINQRQSD